jgi:outer membrane protein TolC
MRTVLIAALLTITAGHTEAAQVTLQEALRAAVAKRPAAQAARSQAEAATAAVAEVRSGWLPHVTLHERYTRTDEPAGSLFIALNQERNVMADPAYDLVDPNLQDDFETRLQLSQTLYDPTVDYGLRRAKTLQRAAEAGAVWSTEEAGFAAFRAYLEAQHSEAALAWVTSSRREAEEIVRLAGERRQAGIGLKADELRAGVYLAEAQRRELAAANDLALARRRLALTMGEPGGEPEIAGPLDEGSFPTIPPPDSIEGRADLAALTLQAEAAGLAVSESRAAWLPSLDLNAHYAWHDEHTPFGSESESWAIGAGLSWELFDGLRRNAGTTRTTATLHAEQARLEETRREQNFLLAEARLRAEEARLHRESARQAVQAASEGQRLYRERYEAGLADLADLLAAQSALDRARFDAVGATTRRLLALGNVQFQAGRFLATFLPEKEIPQ